MTKKIKILIVEELKVYVEALYKLFETIENIELVHVIDHGEELLQYLENNRVDIVLTELDYRNMTGFELASQVRKNYPEIQIIAFSSYVKPIYIQFAIYSGIKGFVNKRDDFQTLLDVIQIVAYGGTVYPEPFTHLSLKVENDPLEKLTKKENEVARLMLFGRTNHQVATEMCISKKTVESHKMNIYRKLEINSVDSLRSMILKSPV